MSLTRFQDWDIKLHEYVEQKVGKPFAYGENDCALFVAGAVLAMTGTDLAADYRGKYTDLKTSLETIKAITDGSTVEDVIDHVATQFGLPELKSVLLAKRGDIVLFDNDGALALGIVHLDGVHALFVSERGLNKIKVKQCRRAWRVA